MLIGTFCGIPGLKKHTADLKVLHSFFRTRLEKIDSNDKQKEN